MEEGGVCVLDESGFIQACNDVFGMLLEQENASVVVGKKLLEVCPAKLRAPLSMAYHQVVESRYPTHFVVDQLNIFALTLVGGTGENLFLLVTYPRKIISPTYNSALPAFFVQNPWGNIVAVSEEFFKIFYGKMLSLDFHEDATTYISPVEISRARRDFARLVSGQPLLREHYILRESTSGSPISAFVTALPLYGKGREFFGVVGWVTPSSVSTSNPYSTMHDILATLQSLERKIQGFPTRALHHTAAKTASISTILSPREIEVLRLIAEGHSLQEMTRILDLSPNTVETYRRSIMNKLRLSSNAHLVRAAVFYGLVPENPWS